MKKLVVSLLVLPLISIVLAVVFILTIDPTRLAPLIQEQLANQGVDARINGKIGWQFYPDIGLSVSGLELRSLSPEISKSATFPELAKLGKVSFAVELRPLFSRQIRVKGIRVEDATINLFVDASGQSNWQLPEQSENPASTPTENPTENTEQGPAPELSIQSLEVHDLNVIYDDRSTQTYAKLSRFNLKASDLNIDGKAFPLRSDFTIEANKNPAFNMDLETDIAVNKDSGSLALSELLARVSGDKLAEIRINGGLSYLPKNNITQVLADLHINQLDVDQLLALTSNTETPAESSSEPSELPLELLRQFESKAKLRVDQIKGFDLAAQNFLFEVDAKDGFVDIKNLNAGLFNGQLRSNGHLDAKGTEAKVLFQGNAENIDIGALLQQFANNNSLAGATNTDFKVVTSGKTVDELIAKVSADATTQAKSLVLQPLNLEKQYCKLVSLLNAEGAAAQLLNKTEWQAFTELEPVEVKIHYSDNVVEMEKLSARVSSLLTAANGKFNLETGKFDFPISLSLQALGAEAISCMDISKKWLDRSLPLRCKGELGKLGIDTCLPDTDLIKDILAQKYKGQLDAKLAEEKAQLQQKLDAEKARAQEKIDEEKARAKAKADEEKRKAEEKAKKKIDDKLKNLLNKPDTTNQQQGGPQVQPQENTEQQPADPAQADQQETSAQQNTQ